MQLVLHQHTDNFIPKPSQKQQVSNQQLAGFKKGIKREVASYPSLKDETSTGVCMSLPNLMIVMKCWTLIVNLVQKIKSYLKTYNFLFSLFNTHLLTYMGKDIVRRHVHNTEAQAVWKDFQEYMKSSSKVASEKRRLTQYVTNTVLDDNFSCTTEQFVLHFNEQFRQLDEISESYELFSAQSNSSYFRML